MRMVSAPYILFYSFTLITLIMGDDPTYSTPWGPPADAAAAAAADDDDDDDDDAAADDEDYYYCYKCPSVALIPKTCTLSVLYCLKAFILLKPLACFIYFANTSPLCWQTTLNGPIHRWAHYGVTRVANTLCWNLNQNEAHSASVNQQAKGSYRAGMTSHVEL